MVTSNQEGIRRKDVIIVRVGRTVISPRTIVIMRRRVIMLERASEKGIR
jgi:hypothetical protein